MEMDGEVGFELVLVAGAGLKSRRRRRTREKDRIYQIVNTKEKNYIQRAYHFCACCNRKLSKSQKVEFRRMCQALIDSLFCTKTRDPLEMKRNRVRDKTLLCTNFIIAKDKIREDLSKFCSDLRWDDRFHDTLVAGGAVPLP